MHPPKPDLTGSPQEFTYHRTTQLAGQTHRTTNGRRLLGCDQSSQSFFTVLQLRMVHAAPVFDSHRVLLALDLPRPLGV